MSRLVVDIDALDRLVARMTRLQEHVARACADADTQVRELSESWSGSAASDYRAAHDRWRAGAAEAQDALVVLRSIASTAHANYVAAAVANRRMWQS
jgi:WXG100 family type VII secretion target